MRKNQPPRDSDDQIDIEDEDAPQIVAAEHKQSFMSFLKRILGQDVDSLRISVPLFLLEPVSNLEYLADLSHVEYFVSASHQPNPVKRMVSVFMIQVTGLKKALKKAKKPLNPILGEVYFSYFTAGMPSSNAMFNGSAVPLDPDSPRVLMVAEQVSHHPPISAFYCVCAERNIDVTLKYDVKAKYTGMSFSLQNNSFARVNIKDFDEEYVIQYPNAQLVGVLTGNFRLMWTGTCSVECRKSNLKSSITFKEKKWFGRETYELSGTIHDLDNPSNVHATLSGTWNDTIYIEYVGNPKETLFSIHSPSQYHPHMVPPEVCPKNQSRNVWGGVIEVMLAGDNNRASKLKNEVENRQRKLEKERNEGLREPYMPVYFNYDPATGTCEYNGTHIKTPEEWEAEYEAQKAESVIAAETTHNDANNDGPVSKSPAVDSGITTTTTVPNHPKTSPEPGSGSEGGFMSAQELASGDDEPSEPSYQGSGTSTPRHAPAEPTQELATQLAEPPQGEAQAS